MVKSNERKEVGDDDDDDADNNRDVCDDVATATAEVVTVEADVDDDDDVDDNDEVKEGIVMASSWRCAEMRASIKGNNFMPNGPQN